jgi:peptidylprolyl isomerase
MKTIEKDNVIQVHYTGTLADGEVFDSSQGRDPLEITMGHGQLIRGFEEALIGMALNEKKTFTLEPEQAYGQRNEESVRAFPRAQIPPEIDVQLGQVLALSNSQGQQIPAKVIELDEENVTLDLNHPLAGQSLTFDIEVVGITT